MSEAQPFNKPEEEVEVSTLTDREHEIILYNDDVNTF